MDISLDDIFTDEELEEIIDMESLPKGGLAVSISENDAAVGALPSPSQPTSGSNKRQPRSWVFKNGWAKRGLSKDGKVEVIICLYPGCQAQYTHQKSSTSNIIAHLKDKHFLMATDINNDNFLSRTGPMEKFVGKGNKRPADHFTQDDFNTPLLMFLVCNKLPLSLVGSTFFQSLLNMAHQSPSRSFIKLPSNDTVGGMVTNAHVSYEERVRSMFECVPRVSFTMDGWTSPFQDCFICITAHWIDDNWEQKEIILGFEPIVGSHTGSALLDSFVAVVKSFRLQRKLHCITSDNASNMKRMMRLLADLTRQKSDEWNRFTDTEQHVPCLAHVINLAAQEMLGKNGLRAEAPQESLQLDPEDTEAGFTRSFPNQDIVSNDIDYEDNAPFSNPLIKLRRGIIKIRSSPQRLQRFNEHCPADTRKKALILDVKTRWNSTYNMIERALLLRNAYSVICSTEDDLSEFQLQETDWRFLSNLMTVLKWFNDFTVKMSASRSHETIPYTIAVYNRLLDKIEDFMDSYQDSQPDICKAVAAAKGKLQKYYQDTDLTPVYAVATAMHPRMRFQWWKDKDWEPEWLEVAIGSVKRVWSTRYEPAYSVSDNPQTPRIKEVEGDEDDDDELFGISQVLRGNELDEYVNNWMAPVVDKSPLAFWKRNQETWPHLAMMAKDYLAVPATSTPSERCFSQARGILPYTRNRLSKERVKELVLMNSWYKFFNDK